jgi:hypothetical protein
MMFDEHALIVRRIFGDDDVDEFDINVCDDDDDDRFRVLLVDESDKSEKRISDGSCSTRSGDSRSDIISPPVARSYDPSMSDACDSEI